MGAPAIVLPAGETALTHSEGGTREPEPREGGGSPSDCGPPSRSDWHRSVPRGGDWATAVYAVPVVRLLHMDGALALLMCVCIL